MSPALKTHLGHCLAMVYVGSPVKSIIIIIITEAPWLQEDAVYHCPHLLSSWPFPPTSQLQSGGYGSAELQSIASCSFVSEVTCF